MKIQIDNAFKDLNAKMLEKQTNWAVTTYQNFNLGTGENMNGYNIEIESELQILVTAQHNKKKHQAHIHIGRDVTQEDWLLVVEARKAYKVEQKRRADIRSKRLVTSQRLAMLPASERLARARERRQRLEQEAQELEREERYQMQQSGVRKTLIKAANVARRLGFHVRKSTDKGGKVSSYYAYRDNNKPIRISDHVLPVTTERLSNHEYYGSSPFAAEIIIDRPLPPLRVKRLLVLAENGRL